ncbi:hypothetical protein CYMTET_24743 [Cymbomonas tetramitiformis]|uniref:Uncharacterized protein n=1 Tax=Cymbomonas tetramitiformis TaxID=36881 RepID=A0AAE0KZL5_9CHLO|nr:hypothetical protein CYMTET_24743 [Cymbomonas tetramitiformis]
MIRPSPSRRSGLARKNPDEPEAAETPGNTDLVPRSWHFRQGPACNAPPAQLVPRHRRTLIWPAISSQKMALMMTPPPYLKTSLLTLERGSSVEEACEYGASPQPASPPPRVTSPKFVANHLARPVLSYHCRRTRTTSSLTSVGG